MLKKTELAVFVGALVWGGAVGATIATPEATDQQSARGSVVQFNDATTIAKHGADDADDPFDDHGVDLVRQSPTSIAKHGADDADDLCDDQGTDLCKSAA